MNRVQPQGRNQIKETSAMKKDMKLHSSALEEKEKRQHDNAT